MGFSQNIFKGFIRGKLALKFCKVIHKLVIIGIVITYFMGCALNLLDKSFEHEFTFVR